MPPPRWRRRRWQGRPGPGRRGRRRPAPQASPVCCRSPAIAPRQRAGPDKIAAGVALQQPANRGLSTFSGAHQRDHPAKGGRSASAVDADGQDTVEIDRAGENRCARPDVLRHQFACKRRCVEAGVTAFHHAIGWNQVAGAQPHPFAHPQRGCGHVLFPHRRLARAGFDPGSAGQARQSLRANRAVSALPTHGRRSSPGGAERRLSGLRRPMPPPGPARSVGR